MSEKGEIFFSHVYFIIGRKNAGGPRLPAFGFSFIAYYYCFVLSANSLLKSYPGSSYSGRGTLVPIGDSNRSFLMC